jgi:hypothetical protein
VTDRADDPDVGGQQAGDAPHPTGGGESAAATDGESGSVTGGGAPDTGGGDPVDRSRRRALGAVGWGVAAGLGLSTGAATATTATTATGATGRSGRPARRERARRRRSR